jgi:aspartate/methionine/tyrosine aminotransferase
MHTFNAHLGVKKEIRELTFSPIREIVRFAENHNEVIPFWFGEPDVSTPEFICKAAKDALDLGDTFYAPNAGIPNLRAALADYMNDLYRTNITFRQITVSISAMNALMITAQALVKQNSKIVVLLPSWPNIPAVQRIMGAQIEGVPIQMKEGKWKLDLTQLFDACSTNTSVIIINSPNNPSGWTMTTEEQRAVLDFARKKGIWVVSDEVYARLSFNNKQAPSFCEIMEEDDRVVVVNSFSKSWAMTGWRLGWLTAPIEVSKEFEKLTEYNVAGPPPFIQQAGVVALKNGESFIQESNLRYQNALTAFSEWAESESRIEFDRPEATFYAFFKVKHATDSMNMAKDLLVKNNVGLAPGCAFGPQYDSYLRLCFASSLPKLQRGLDGISSWLQGPIDKN